MDEEKLDTFKALEKARETFEKYLREKGYDVAYWDLRLTAWGLSNNEFKPLWKVELDCREGNNE